MHVAESLPEVFFASRNYQLRKLNGWLIIWLSLCFIPAVISGAILGNMVPGLLGYPVVVFSVYWVLRRKKMVNEPSVVISHDAIRSALFRGGLKECFWFSIVGVSVEGKGNRQSLKLHLDKSLGFSDSQSFWFGRNPAFASIPLKYFEPDQKEALYDAVIRQVQAPSDPNPFVLENKQSAEHRALMNSLKSQMPIPWVTYGLIAINVLIWIATVVMGASLWSTPAGNLLSWGGNAASEFQRGEWWRLLTAFFLHSGLIHIAMNMLVLASVGFSVERIYGHLPFLLIYLASGLIGSALSLHYSAQHVVSVGASGAVFGVVGAFLVALLQHRDRFSGALGKQQITNLGFYIIYAVSRGFSEHGIDNAAHIGGLMGGCLLSFVLPERFDMNRYARTLKRRLWVGLGLATITVSILAATAPQTNVDLRARIDLAYAFRAYGVLMKAAQEEQQSVKSGLMSERESDERSRTYFAPRMRETLEKLSSIQMMPSDPYNDLLLETKHISELTLEAFEMPSVYRKGSDKPIPANQPRIAAIEAELKASLQKLQVLLKSL